jgi:hypothetical protein
MCMHRTYIMNRVKIERAAVAARCMLNNVHTVIIIIVRHMNMSMDIARSRVVREETWRRCSNVGLWHIHRQYVVMRTILPAAAAARHVFTFLICVIARRAAKTAHRSGSHRSREQLVKWASDFNKFQHVDNY